MFIPHHKVLCTAGNTYILLYPNGDVYRCMAEYNNKSKPLFNANNEPWQTYDKSCLCHHRACYAGCDLDWTSKNISTSSNDLFKTIPARYVDLDPELGYMWNKQSIINQHDRILCIVWAPTLTCNFDCHYCGCRMIKKEIYKNFNSSHPELSINEWINIFEKILDKYEFISVHITGGEPFLSPALIPVLKKIAHRASICITTNLSFGIENLLQADIRKSYHNKNFQGVFPSGLRRITASFHPSAKKFNEDDFFTRVSMLVKQDFVVDIHFVAHPTQIAIANKIKLWTEENHVGFIVSPWVGTDKDGKLPSYTQNELNILNDFIFQKYIRAMEEIFYTISYELHLDFPKYVSDINKKLSISGSILNTSNCSWKIDENVKIGSRIYSIFDDKITLNEYRAPLHNCLFENGQHQIFDIEIDLNCLQYGKYKIKFDVVKENNFWLQDHGAIPQEFIFTFGI